jgi:dephospho-CoA kinase
MLKVGITGGIGSGKTFICLIFKYLGIPTYHADIESKRLINNDLNLKAAIKKEFGENIYSGEILDRKKLAEIVFANRELLQVINGLVHPVVEQDFERWCNKQKSLYVLEESAIIFENNLAARFDKTILVTSPEDIRIERVCKRDNVYKKDVLLRIKNQWSDEQKVKLADFVINNDGQNLIISQVMQIHKALCDIITYI